MSDLSELSTNKPTITRYGQVGSGSSISITLEYQHVYLLVLAHPNYEDSLYVIVGYSGTNTARVTPISAYSGISVTEDSDMILTITCNSAIAWVDLIDLGDSRYAD